MWQRIFLLLPLISATAFLPSILMSPLLQVKIVGFLAISSLLCTAFVLSTLEVESGHTNTGQNSAQAQGKQRPMRKYLIPLNAVLALLVALNGVKFYFWQGAHGGYWVLCVVPVGEHLRVAWANTTHAKQWFLA